MTWFFGPHHVDNSGYPALWKRLSTCVFECICGCVRVFMCVFAHGGMTQWKWEGKTFRDHSFFTMRVPASVAAVSCLCPLVVILCVVSQSCYGTRVDLSPYTNPNPSLHPNLRLKSLHEPTPLPSFSPEKRMFPMEPSQLSSSSQTLWNKSQLKPRLDTMSYLTENHWSNTKFPSAISQATSSSNTRRKLQHAPNQSSNSRQGLTYNSNSNQVARNALNNAKQSSKINPKNNPKPRVGSLLQPKPKASPNPKVVTRPKTNSESVPNTTLSSLSSPNQRSNSSGTMNPSTYYNASPVSLSNPKSHSKLRPSSQTITNTKSHPKISSPNSRASIRAQRNQTKLLDTDKDFHHQPKRGWIWNQFFVLEEHIGPEPQYVGKVRYPLCFLWPLSCLFQICVGACLMPCYGVITW